MAAAQRKRLVSVGNSRAVLIDKQMLADLGFEEGEVELCVEDGSLVITPVRERSAREIARLEAIAARVKA